MSDTKKLILAAVVVVLLVVGMYIGSKTNRTTFPEAISGTKPTVSPTPSDVVANEIIIENYSFLPANIIVEAGESVTWKNNDTVAHTATADNGTFDTGMIEPGQQKSITFDAPGTYAYYCLPHPQMRGTIIVE